MNLQGTVEADRDGAIRVSDFWRSSVQEFCEASGTELAKADDVHAFGMLALEVVNLLSS